VKIAEALLHLLALITEWIERHKRSQKAKEDQAEHDQISENPGAWMADHFNRVRDVPGDTAKTSETPHRDDNPA